MYRTSSRKEAMVQLLIGRHTDSTSGALLRHRKLFEIASPMSSLLMRTPTGIFRSSMTKAHAAVPVPHPLNSRRRALRLQSSTTPRVSGTAGNV